MVYYLLIGLDMTRGVGTPTAFTLCWAGILDSGDKGSGVWLRDVLGWGLPRCGGPRKFGGYRGESESIGGRYKLFFDPGRCNGGVGSQSCDWDAVGSMSVSEPSLPGESWNVKKNWNKNKKLCLKEILAENSGLFKNFLT